MFDKQNDLFRISAYVANYIGVSTIETTFIFTSRGLSINLIFLSKKNSLQGLQGCFGRHQIVTTVYIFHIIASRPESCWIVPIRRSKEFCNDQDDLSDFNTGFHCRRQQLLGPTTSATNSEKKWWTLGYFDPSHHPDNLRVVSTRSCAIFRDLPDRPYRSQLPSRRLRLPQSSGSSRAASPRHFLLIVATRSDYMDTTS